MKKPLSMFLSLIMLLCVMSGLSFTAQAATLINSITIQEVVVPRPGATPSTNWSKTGASWYTDGIKWYEAPDSGHDIPLSSDSKFVEGKKYKASFVAWANSDCDFVEISAINATIDGFNASVSQYSGRDTKRVVLVSYTFTCEYKKISSVVLTSNPFEKGTELTTDFFHTQGEGVNQFCVSTFTRNGESIAIGEKVTYGDYGANIILAPMENYIFADNVRVTMGNNAFTVVDRIGKGIIVKSADDLWHIDCEHSYGAYEYDATTHWKSCLSCGDKANVDGHSLSESTVAGNTVYTCSICNYVKTAKNKVDGYLYADVTGGVQIVAYDGSEINLTVPSTLGGKTVVSIGDYAFAKYANKTTFKSITFPSTITSIGKGAFDGCTALTSINIPSAVKRIEAETFMECMELKSIIIPYGVNFIGESAFQGCGIYSITIPCSVKTIKGSAFRSCTNLGSIVIPDSVTELGNAFMSCSALESVVIGSGINSIAQATFDGCKGINILTLPVELTTIGKYNFDSGSVNTVNYSGTEARFNEMSISTNTDLTSATKNYNYKEKIDIGQHKYIAAQTVAPNCVNEGYTLNMCEGCCDAFRSNVTKATSVHIYSSGVITTMPTCASTGVKTYLCNDCGIAKAETVSATGNHTGGTATCKVKAKCTACGAYYGSLNANNHKNITNLKKVDATCTKTGLTEGKKCADCGKITVVQKTVAVKAHREVAIPAKAATYKATGLTAGKKCADCGKITVAQKKTDRKKLKKVSGLKTKAVKLASGSKSTLTLSWSKVTGAEKYQVQQYVNKKWKTVKTTSKTSYTVTKLKANKSYKFRVRAVAGKYYGKYSSTYTANTVPLKTTLTLKAEKKQLTASWKEIANITGYEVQYSTSKKFTKKTTKIVTVKKAKTKKTTIKKLSKGKKYYVKVRAYKTVGKTKIYSAWSSVKYVKVK